MNDGYFEEPKRNRGGGWKYAIVALVSLLVGALIMVAFAPSLLAMFGGSLTGEQGGQATPTATAAPTDTPQADLGSEAPSIDQSNPVVDINKNVGPAVVLVSNRAKGLDKNKGIVSQEQGSGSGVVVSKDGYIVTNNHVIEDADEVYVTFVGGQTIQAQVVGADSRSDLAVLQVDPSKVDNFTVAALGDSDQVEVGDLAVAIGNPMGSELAGTVTVGYISGLHREVVLDGVSFSLIQTDASINPGNSGGALVNSKGEVIGINSAKSYLAGYDTSGNPISSDGIGFAIPINDAKPIINEIISNGYISRPGIGIQGVAIGEEYEASGVPSGIMVREFSDDSSAAKKAGLQIYDIITEINGKKISAFKDMWDELDNYKPGDEVELTVWRQTGDNKSDTLKIKVTLQELKEE